MSVIHSRKSSIDVRYNGKNAAQKLMSKLTNFTYVDVAGGESDTISLEFENIDRKWLQSWIPKKGDLLKAFIYTSNWKKHGEQKNFVCGTFLLDDFAVSGRPMVCSVNAVSAPIHSSFSSTKRTVVWEKVSIESIVGTVAKRSGIQYVYDAETIMMSTLEQSEETDCEFLYKLCKKYGLSMKVYSNKLVIFDREKYKAKPAVVILNEEDLIPPWSYSSSLEGTYTGGKIQYTDISGNDYEYSFGTQERMLELNEKASSKLDAERIIKAAVKDANHMGTVLNIVFVADLRIVASSNVEVRGLGKLDGKYYVNRVTHNRGGSSGYTMSLELSLVG